MTKTFDLFGALVFLPCLILLAVGVIPLTAGWVALIIFLGHVNLTVSWSR